MMDNKLGFFTRKQARAIRSVNLSTKIMIIILAVIISYLIPFLILNRLLVPQKSTMYDMMRYMMRSRQDNVVINLVSFTSALSVGALMSFWLKIGEIGKSKANIDELEIIKRALSDDEKTVVDEIKRAGEITQDSLRFRLNWSKSKVSRILVNLDKMNLIQRERMGKTYNDLSIVAWIWSHEDKKRAEAHRVCVDHHWIRWSDLVDTARMERIWLEP
jgi:predicted transcriptional regulator